MLRQTLETDWEGEKAGGRRQEGEFKPLLWGGFAFLDITSPGIVLRCTPQPSQPTQVYIPTNVFPVAVVKILNEKHQRLSLCARSRRKRKAKAEFSSFFKSQFRRAKHYDMQDVLFVPSSPSSSSRLYYVVVFNDVGRSGAIWNF